MNASKNYLFGQHAVMALLREHPERCQQLMLLSNRHDQRQNEIVQMAQKYGIPLQTVGRAVLDNLAAGANHQGVIAQLSATPQYTEEDLDALLDRASSPAFLLILDGVQDPHNLGACLRTANAAGAQAVIIPKDKSASLTPTVQKVASGAAETTPLIAVTNLARTLRDLKARGIWIYGASDKASATLYQTDLRGPIAWVLGAEGTGLRALTQENCDHLVAILMMGSVSSLNVSVAAGVCLFETVRQQGRK